MVIQTPEDIDFSTFPDSDGQPMAETYPNVLQMLDLLFVLQHLFDMQGRGPRTSVGANQFVYYNRYNGRDNISPDVYVIFDHPTPTPPSWKTWIEGKFPDVVFEITSPSTQAQDLSDAPGGKRRLYAELGAREYYIYDPQQVMRPSLLGYEARAGRMEPLSATPGGGIMSPLLGAELRPMAMGETAERMAGVWLRVIDPRTGEPIPTAEEDRANLRVARERMALEERLRVSLEDQLSLEERLRTELEGQLAAGARLRTELREQVNLEKRISAAAERRADLAQERADLEGRARVAEEATRVAAEGRADAHERARIAAEERAARAEAALQVLLADQARRQDDGPAPE